MKGYFRSVQEDLQELNDVGVFLGDGAEFLESHDLRKVLDLG